MYMINFYVEIRKNGIYHGIYNIFIEENLWQLNCICCVDLKT